MSNYKIKVNIEIVECQDPVQVRPIKLEEGCFEFNSTLAILDKTRG